MNALDTLRIVTLNIWNRSGPWEGRRELIRDGLRAQAADVVGLQEVLRVGSETPIFNQLDELGEGIYPHRVYGCAHVLMPEGPLELGNAVLSRHPIVDTQRFTLPNPLQQESRCLLYVLCATPAGLLPVFVTHLDWQLHLSHARCQQVRYISERIDEIRDALLGGRLPAGLEGREVPNRDVLPIVLCGDFNAEPESDEIRYLHGHHALPATANTGEAALRGVFYQDAFGLAGDPADCDAPRRGPAVWGATFARSNPYAAVELEPDRRLDYIFVGSPDRKRRGEVLRAGRCFTESKDGVYASDHYGVYADLHVAPRIRPSF